MPLLKQLLKVNKWLVEATTPMFYIIGAITMFVLGAVSLSSETVAFKPELPIWEAQIFQWGGIVAICAFTVYTITQMTIYIVEKIKARRERDAIH